MNKINTKEINLMPDQNVIDGMTVESVHECLCGASTTDRYLQLGNWTVTFCSSCGLGRTNPRPKANELTQQYANGVYHDQDKIASSKEIEKNIRKLHKRIRFIKRVIQAGRLLDVGCNIGFFLEAANRAGFVVEGIEPSVETAIKARQLFAHNVYPITLEEFFQRNGSNFDVVTMWHVLEHLANPFECLMKIRNRLNFEGIIVIEVPNFASIDAHHLGTKWAKWQPPYHLWHFNPQSLSECLEKAGFMPLKIQYSSSQYVRDILRPYPFINLFRDLIAVCFAGEVVRIVARKTL